MEKSDLISVIVTAYNIEAYLPNCLETIACQTYQNLEIILVDDGSTDGSGVICDNFAKRDSRAVVIHQPNSGVWVARNTGLNEANGDFIMFVDSDDYLHLSAIEMMHESLKQSPASDFVMANHSETHHLNHDIHSACEISIAELSQEELVYAFIHGGNPACTLWNKLFKKELLRNMLFRNYPLGEDSDFVLRAILKSHKAVWLHAICYYYVQRIGSLVHNDCANISITRCLSDIFYDNLQELPPSRERYQHEFLRVLYRFMASYIQASLGTDEHVTAMQKCRKYERSVRRRYWHCRQIGFVEKTAMTINVRYPNTIRRLKRIFGKRFSWHMLSKF